MEQKVVRPGQLVLALALMLLVRPAFPQYHSDSLWQVWSDVDRPMNARALALKHLYAQDSLLQPAEAARRVLPERDQEAHGVACQEAFAWQVLGRHQLAVKMKQEGLTSLHAARDRSRACGDAAMQGGTERMIGGVHQKEGRFDLAMDHMVRALHIHEQAGDTANICNALNSIAYIFGILGDGQRMVDTYRRSIRLADPHHPQLLFNALYGLADDGPTILSNVERRKIWEQAKEMMATGQVEKVASYRRYTQDGYFHLLEESCDSALTAFDHALAHSPSNEWTSYLLASKARALICTGHFREAGALAEKGIDLARTHDMRKELLDNLPVLSDAYEGLGDPARALDTWKQYHALKDSLGMQRAMADLAGIMITRDLEQRLQQDSLANEQQRLLLMLENEAQLSRERNTRNLMTFAGVGSLLLALGLWSRLRHVRRARAAIQRERDRSENLLLNILPAEIAEELKQKGKCEARDFDTVSILFTDFKGFTEHSATMSAAALVNEINHCFEAFDGIMAKYGIEKIKTIGDAYMAAGGLPVPAEDSVKNTVLAALEMQQFIRERKVQKDAFGEPAFEMRVGIHTGPVVAGIVGVKKFQYDIWGDTVNTASRMESHGVVGQVNISESTHDLLKNDPQFRFAPRGKVEAKGKGRLEMFLVQENETSMVWPKERPVESTPV
jgi:adenylate cyclase